MDLEMDGAGRWVDQESRGLVGALQGPHSPALSNLRAQMDHNCLFNASTTAPYCDCANPSALNDYIAQTQNPSTENISSNTCVVRGRSRQCVL